MQTKNLNAMFWFRTNSATAHTYKNEAFLVEMQKRKKRVQKKRTIFTTNATSTATEIEATQWRVSAILSFLSTFFLYSCFICIHVLVLCNLYIFEMAKSESKNKNHSNIIFNAYNFCCFRNF